MSGFGKGITKQAGPETEGAGQTLGGRLSNGMKVAAAAGAAAIGAVLAKGIADNINIGKANDKLAAQLGLSAKESQRVGKIAGSLYRDAYGDSIEGVNTAVGAVMSGIEGMAKASSKELEGVTATALDFATAFEVDVERAVQIAGQAVSTGLAGDATEAFDLITAAAQKVPSALREDLLDATDEYGQFFATLGYDGEQAMAMLVDASEDGMYGIDKAGDAIKEFTIRSTDMSTSSKDAYAAIGLNAREMANDILAGGDTAQGATQKIIDGILGIKDPAAQAEAAIALFGTPLEDLNVNEIPAFLESMQGGSESMDDFGGAAKEMGDTLNDNFATRMEGWKRTAMGFVQDGLMKLADWGAKAFAWAKDNEAWLAPLVAGIGTIAGIILAIVGAMKVWTAITAAYTAVQAALNAVMLANPIGLVVIAIAGLVAAFVVAYKKSETFRNIVDGAMQGVKNVVSAVVDWFKDSFVPFFTKKIPEAFRATVDWVRTKWTAVKELIKAPVIAARDAVERAWGTITDAFKDAKDWALGAFKTAWDGLKEVVVAPVRGAKIVVGTLLDNVKAGFILIKDWVLGAFKLAWDRLTNIITDPIQTAKNVFHNLLGPGGTIRQTFNNGVDAIKNAWERLREAAKKPVNFIIDTVYNDGIRKGFNSVAGFLGLDTKLPRMDPIGGGGSAPLPRRTLPGTQAMGGVGDTIKGWVGKGWDFVKDKAFGGISGLIDRVGSSPWAKIVGGMGSKLMSAALGALRGKFADSTDAGLPSGMIGKAGAVLPAGSYRIGMPYLGYSGHYGADYPANIGTPVFAPWPGRVTASYDLPGSNEYNDSPYRSYGRVVQIQYENGLSSLFAHLDSRIGSTGPVAAGQVVGTVGNNGKSTGPHLHAEFRRNGGTINPASLGLFDNGGWLRHGQAALNLSGRPEPVFSGGQWDTLQQVAASGVGGNGDVLAELQALRAEVRRLPDRAQTLRRQG